MCYVGRTISSHAHTICNMFFQRRHKKYNFKKCVAINWLMYVIKVREVDLLIHNKKYNMYM